MDLFSVLTMIGGLVFFLYGMKVMSASLEKMAGGKLEHMLKRVTAHPMASLLLGAAITIAMQSSSATTVMLVGLVNSGLMQFAQTVYVSFGANIGTTLTAWILGLSGIQSSNILIQMLKPINFSPIIALIGIGLLMFSKSDRKRSVGTVGVGFALLMYGMTMMADAVSPLAEMPGFDRVLAYLDHPLIGLLVALLFTAVIQSSAASIGILQALALTGGLSYGMVIPMVMGLNIGTCITSLISCIGANTNARRVGAFHVAANVIGTVVFLPLFLLLDGIFAFPFTDTAVTPWGIAGIHTAFNLLLTVLLMPFSKLLVKGITFFVREKKQKAAEELQLPEEPVLDARLLRSPSVAIAECMEQAARMGKLANDTVFAAFDILYRYDESAAERILAQEDRLDLMEDRLGTYLVPIGSTSLSGPDSRRVAAMLHNIGDFERLGDHAVNLLKVSKEMSDQGISFSEEAMKEIAVLTDAATEILNITHQAFLEKDAAMAGRVEPLEQVIDKLIAQIRSRHIDRLCAGDCSIEMGFVLSDLLTNFERISDHCSNIAVSVIELAHGSFETHGYLNRIKSGDGEFLAMFDEFDAKYSIG